MLTLAEILQSISELRKLNPLILHLSNSVAMEFSANALLALRASPIVSLEPKEIEDLIAHPGMGAVVVNLGTPHERWAKAAHRAAKAAVKYEKPIIFDPVGVGASRYRTDFTNRFLAEYSVDLVRGNASEIFSILGGQPTGKGVDAGMSPDQALSKFRDRTNGPSPTFIISGPQDFIVDREKVVCIDNGCPEMTSITAMGCVSTCLIGAFRTVLPAVDAATQAMALMGLAGEGARDQSHGPGSMKTVFLDLLANPERLSPYQLRVGVR